MKTLEWKHSETHDDWSLFVPLPNGSIRATVFFSNRNPDDHTSWGTVETTAGERSELGVSKYKTPAEAIDAVNLFVISVMADIIAHLTIH